MITKIKPAEPSTRDLIDRIAKALPPEIGAAYYREMMYCRSLQENDEILRILRAMQFLTLLMDQVPARVVIERERLEQLFTSAIRELGRTVERNEAFRNHMDERLTELPAKIAEGIKPATIADEITETLNQQFLNSTIPKTAEALRLVAEQMKKTTSEFGTTANALGRSYGGAAEEARRAIDSLSATIHEAASCARKAADDLSVKFHDSYWMTLIGLACLALLVGFTVGIWVCHWIDPPEVQIIERAITLPTEALPPIEELRKSHKE